MRHLARLASFLFLLFLVAAGELGNFEVGGPSASLGDCHEGAAEPLVSGHQDAAADPAIAQRPSTADTPHSPASCAADGETGPGIFRGTAASAISAAGGESTYADAAAPSSSRPTPGPGTSRILDDAGACYGALDQGRDGAEAGGRESQQPPMQLGQLPVNDGGKLQGHVPPITAVTGTSAHGVANGTLAAEGDQRGVGTGPSQFDNGTAASASPVSAAQDAPQSPVITSQQQQQQQQAASMPPLTAAQPTPPAPEPQVAPQPPTHPSAPPTTDAAASPPAVQPAKQAVQPPAQPTQQASATTAPPAAAPPQPEQRKRGTHTLIPKPDEFVMSIPTSDLSLGVLSGGGGEASGSTGGAASSFSDDIFLDGFSVNGGATNGDADSRQATPDGGLGPMLGADYAVGLGGTAGSGSATAGMGLGTMPTNGVGAGGGAAPVGLGPLDADYEDEDEGRKINLASSSDGASIVAANKEAKRPERLIDGDDDSYMKNACSASKWVIVELSQLGRVDQIKLTMKEMYSSRVRDFVIKGRQSHPKKDGLADYGRGLELEGWQVLGTFRADNRKGSQVFRLPRKARVRYLLLQVLSYYGTEEMCALNSMEVRGVTAAQELEAALSRPLSAPPPAAAAAPARAPAAPASQPPPAATPPPPPPAAAPVQTPSPSASPPPPSTSTGASSSGPSSPAAHPATGPHRARESHSSAVLEGGKEAIPLPPVKPAGQSEGGADSQRGGASGVAASSSVEALNAGQTGSAGGPTAAPPAGVPVLASPHTKEDVSAPTPSGEGEQAQGASSCAVSNVVDAGNGSSRGTGSTSAAVQQLVIPAALEVSGTKPVSTGPQVEPNGTVAEAQDGAAGRRTEDAPAGGNASCQAQGKAAAVGHDGHVPPGVADKPDAGPDTSGAPGTATQDARQLHTGPSGVLWEGASGAKHDNSSSQATSSTGSAGCGETFQGAGSSREPRPAGGPPCAGLPMDEVPTCEAGVGATVHSDAPLSSPPVNVSAGSGAVVVDESIPAADNAVAGLAAGKRQGSSGEAVPNAVPSSNASGGPVVQGNTSIGASKQPGCAAASDTGVAAPGVTAGGGQSVASSTTGPDAVGAGSLPPQPGLSNANVSTPTGSEPPANGTAAQAPGHVNTKGHAAKDQQQAVNASATGPVPPVSPAAAGSAPTPTSAPSAPPPTATAGAGAAAPVGGAAPAPTPGSPAVSTHTASTLPTPAALVPSDAASSNPAPVSMHGAGPATVTTPISTAAATATAAGMPAPVVPAAPALDSLLSVFDGGSASKPRPAGNLFDVVKGEMMMLRLNQTRLWQYIQALVDALNARHAELEADAQAMEDKISDLEKRLLVNEAATAAAREAHVAPLLELAARLAELERRTVRTETLGSGALLCSGVVLVLAALAGPGSGRWGMVRLLMVLMGAANGVAGLVLKGSLPAATLVWYGEAAVGIAVRLAAQASDVLRSWRG